MNFSTPLSSRFGCSLASKEVVEVCLVTGKFEVSSTIVDTLALLSALGGDLLPGDLLARSGLGLTFSLFYYSILMKDSMTVGSLFSSGSTKANVFGASLPILTTRCFSEVFSRGVVTTTRLGEREGVITLPVKLFTTVGLIVN